MRTQAALQNIADRLQKELSGPNWDADRVRHLAQTALDILAPSYATGTEQPPSLATLHDIASNPDPRD